VASQRVSFTLNGEPVSAESEAGAPLVELLREQLGRTGTKLGCGVGVCGVCSVLIDGVLLSACLVPAVRVEGTEVRTSEGLAAQDGTLTELQQAFIDQGGFQCGICTSGQLMAASALLAERPHPDDEQIAEWMKGNLCRCTGYYGIARAIRAAAGAAE
jgi:aerobic-type carbon monoxide dehydrogenase small subunit (CoxS/CutS family)